MSVGLETLLFIALQGIRGGDLCRPTSRSVRRRSRRP